MTGLRAELLRLLDLAPEAGRPETLALATAADPEEVLNELRVLDDLGHVVLEEADWGRRLPYPVEVPPLKRHRAAITEAGRRAIPWVAGAKDEEERGGHSESGDANKPHNTLERDPGEHPP